MSQKQRLLVCIILLYILTLLMLVHYREIINNAPLSQIVKLQKKVVRMNGVPLMESITPH